MGVLFAPAGVWSKCGGEVDFDELAGESEPGHAQERARSGERRSDDRKGELAPGRGKNRVVIVYDVDNRTDDLIRPGADRGEPLVTIPTWCALLRPRSDTVKLVSWPGRCQDRWS